MFAVAHLLGRTLDQILDMTVSEFNAWVGYFQASGHLQPPESDLP